MRIMAIDPGLNQTGVAIEDELGIRCYTVKGSKSRDLAIRARHIVNRIEYPFVVDCLTVEMPMIYRDTKREIDPNSIIKLSVLVGAMVGVLNARRIMLPHPRTWKKQVPKDIHHRRILKALPELVGVNHSKDALDAAGLLLWTKEKLNA